MPLQPEQRRHRAGGAKRRAFSLEEQMLYMQHHFGPVYPPMGGEWSARTGAHMNTMHTCACGCAWGNVVDMAVLVDGAGIGHDAA